MLAATLLPLLAFASTAFALPAPQVEARNDGLPEGFYRTGRCLIDNVNSRVFRGADLNSGAMTHEKCIDFCFTQRGWQVAALENGNECFCGSKSDISSAVEVASAECSESCTGAAGQKCGAPNRLSLLITNDVKAVAKTSSFTEVPNMPEWQFKNQCIRDNVPGRVFSIQKNDPAMTWQMCSSFCDSKGMNIAALEYSSECFCGDAATLNANYPGESGRCEMYCSGDPSQLCGGPNALSIIYKGGRQTQTIQVV